MNKEIVKDRVEKLKRDKEATALERTEGQIIPFPKLNISDLFLERFRCICKKMIIDGDPVKEKTFLKRFIEKIILTKNACKVTYNLTGIVPTNEDCSSLRENMVVPTGVEPVLPT